MILSTMTNAEIANEINKDRKSLDAFIVRTLTESKYRKIALKHTPPIAFKPIFWTSRRHNKYCIIPHTNGKNDYKRLGLCYSVYCYHIGKHNHLDAVMISKDGNYLFFKSHLFDRYAERFLADSSLQKLEVMVNFFSKNSIFVHQRFDCPKYPNNWLGSSKEGVILGEYENGFMVCKTFLTEDMLKGLEIELDASNVEILKDGIALRFNDDYCWQQAMKNYIKLVKAA